MPASPARVRLIATAAVSVTAATAVAVGVATAGTGGSPRATNPGFGYGYNCAAFGGYGYGYGFSTTPCPPKTPSTSPSPVKTTVTVVPSVVKVVIKRSGHLHKGKQVVFDFTHIKPGAIDIFNQFKPVKNKTGHGYHFLKIKQYKIKAFTGGNIHYGIYLGFVGTGKTVVVLTDANGLRRTFVLTYYVNP